ncbi:MAG TPA: YjfB family protein [Pseudogracilibacillus sp.]|nr:YjfB family protein [Pseudogracilibacillus sp.]
MDIAAMSMALSQANVKQQASLAVMKKAMTTTETNAQGLIDMLNQSVGNNAPHPYLGGKVDVKA